MTMGTAASAAPDQSLTSRIVSSVQSLSWGLRALALFGAAVLTGCASEPEPVPVPPTEIVAQVAAVDSLNPDSQGRSSPLVVRLFELTAASPFDTADFFDLYDQDRATLGDSLVAMDEIRVAPSETKTIPRTLDDRTRFIGVVAAFRDVELSSWRGLVEVPLNQTTTFALTLDSLSVSIKPAEL